MSVTGVESVRANLMRALADIKGARTELAITEMLIVAEGYTLPLVPVATSNLINSAYRNVTPEANGWKGELGFSAGYALYVHNAPGTLQGTNTPRYPKSDGVVWGPNAEPEFLTKGVEMMLSQDANNILSEAYRV